MGLFCIIFITLIIFKFNAFVFFEIDFIFDFSHAKTMNFHPFF